MTEYSMKSGQEPETALASSTTGRHARNISGGTRVILELEAMDVTASACTGTERFVYLYGAEGLEHTGTESVRLSCDVK